MEQTRIDIIRVFRIYMILFFILGMYIAYVQVGQSHEYMSRDDNPRNFEKVLFRGTIYARDGQVLSVSREGAKPEGRFFPLKAYAEPLMGYFSYTYGKGGMEDKLDNYLKPPELSNDLKGYIFREQPKGCDVYLTIDPLLQVEAAKALEGKKGSIIIMNPSNGEILALASSPSFKPAEVDVKWKQLTSSQDSPLLLRPVNGNYPPGSVFKLFTLAACLEEGTVTSDTSFYCSGDYPMSYALGTYHISEAGGSSHGNVTAEDALVYSCNIALAQMGLKLGTDKFVEYAGRFGLNEKPPFIMWDTMNYFPTANEFTPTLLAQSAFGQGELSFSPLSIALMVSAFANNGKIYEPRIIKSVVDEKGETKLKIYHKVWKTPIGPETANKVKDAMVQVVERGTGTNARIDGLKIAGKTGSAENPKGDTHAWFVCFAPADNPTLLMVVMVENGGYGGRTAAPIAKELLLKAGKYLPLKKLEDGYQR